MSGLNTPIADSVTDAEVRHALSGVTRTRVHYFLPVALLVYLLISLVHLKTATTGTLAEPVLVTGIGCLMVWVAGLRKLLPDALVQPALAVTQMLMVGDCLWQLNAAANSTQVVVVLLLMLAAAGTLLSRLWFALFTLSASAGWIAVGAETLPSQAGTPLALAVFFTAALSWIAFEARLRKQYDVQKVRLEAEKQTAHERQLRERTELAIQGSRDGLWYWEVESGNFQFSSNWAALLGYEPGELLGNVDEWFSRVHPGYVAELRAGIDHHLQGNSDHFQHEHRLRRKDGAYVWVTVRGTTVRNSEGKAVAMAGAHSDISSVLSMETHVLDDTFHDKLTGLPNRQFFLKHLELAMEGDRRTGKLSRLFAVMFLDLDRFKIINDSLGHLAGDQLLTAVSGRLRNCARQDDVIARFGGDEFVVLLNPVRDVAEATAAAARFRRALSEPFEIDGKEVASGASIGVVLSNQNAARAEDYLRYADMALYHAKAYCKGDVQFFNEEMTAEAVRLCDLQNDLARALGRNELMMYYQPLVSIGSGQICGAEALIRWKRSDGRVMLPGDFIPIAEDMGLINEIGEWALRTACAQNSAWQRAGLPEMRVSVNLSARQLRESDFTRRVVQALRDTHLGSHWLELELTETALMDGLDRAPGTLEQLAKHGVRIAIDDFGTGYSSLNYLRRHNFHRLKMDRCFVSDIVTDQKTGAIAKGLIHLAHNLDLSVVAEGVERRDQLNFLTAERCDAVQGYLASTPVAPEDFTRLLQAGSVGARLLHDPSQPAWEDQGIVDGLTSLSRA